MTRSLVCAGLLAVLAGPAIAESYDATGVAYATSSSMQMPVGETMVVIHAATDYDRFEMSDADNPLASLTGPCFGSILVNAGQVSGSGNCHYTDGDGDIAVLEWQAEGMSDDGKTAGSWSILGGTGKWAEAEGGGTFNAGDDESGNYRNDITGEFTLP